MPLNRQRRAIDLKSPQFSHKVSIIVISAASIILLTAVSILVFLNITDIDNRTEKLLAKFGDLLGTSLVSVVWQLDKPAMDNMLRALINNDFVVYADIKIDDQTIAKEQRPEYIGKTFYHFRTSSDFVIKSIPIRYLDKQIGLVRVVFHYKKLLYDELIPQLKKLAILSFILLVVSLLIIIFLSRWFILKPLAQLEGIATSLVEGKLDVPDTFSLFTKREDIFGILGQAFVEMVNQQKSNIRSLDFKVQQRTRELEKSRQEAVAASKAKSTFLSNMSHEIRTPLNSILGMTELLLESPPQAKQRELLHSLEASGEILLTLTNDILDLSKIESQQLYLERINFNLKDHIDDLCRILQVQAQEKNLSFDCHVDEDVFTNRLGDPVRLRQILINLLGNAIKFTACGEVSLRVSNSRFSSDDDHVSFVVRDTGIGISKEKQSIIFKSFTQADMSTTRKFGGSGLGLAITHSLVRKMGGQINVRSEEGSGTEFRVFLPLACATSSPVRQEPIAATQEPIAATQDLSPFPKLHVLLAEDIPENRNVIRLFLEELPITLDIAENGRQAADKVKQGHYDCILMDIQMPVLDGLDATREIRRWELKNGRDPVFVFALTAYAFEDEHEKCRDAGCDMVLVKPVKKHLLLDRLGTVARSARESGKPDFRPAFRETVDKEVKELLPEFFQEMKETLATLKTALKNSELEKIQKLGAGIRDAARSYDLEILSNIISNLLQASAEHTGDQGEMYLDSALQYLREVEIIYE